MSGQGPRQRGRPTSLNPEVADRLRQLVRTGIPLDQAAAAAGVSARSVRRWRAAGQLQLDEAAGEIGLTLAIARSTPRSWRAAAFMLERRFPERWAPPRRRPPAP